jgi:PBSX family phage terminase large subunit
MIWDAEEEDIQSREVFIPNKLHYLLQIPSGIIAGYQNKEYIKIPNKNRQDFDKTFQMLVSGRGCGKTKAACLIIITRALMPEYSSAPNFFIFRQNANILDDSIMPELKWAIDELGVSEFFDCNKYRVKCKTTGVTIKAKGVAGKHIESLKGLVSNFAILEEATTLTKNEWDTLIPTIVRQQGSQIMILANPNDKYSTFYNYFFDKLREDTHYIELAHNDNIFFSNSDLQEQMEIDRERMPTPEFYNKWYGEWLTESSALIKKMWLEDHLYESLEDVDIKEVFITCDTAVKKGRENDYTVAMVWATDGNCIYLLEMVRDKLFFPELKKTITRLWEKYINNPVKNIKPSKIIIEDQSSGSSLIQDLRYNSNVVVDPLARKGIGKVERVELQIDKLASGKVRLPRFQEEITRDIIRECISFTKADKHEHDDIVDALVDAVAYTFDKPKEDFASAFTMSSF